MRRSPRSKRTPKATGRSTARPCWRAAAPAAPGAPRTSPRRTTEVDHGALRRRLQNLQPQPRARPARAPGQHACSRPEASEEAPYLRDNTEPATYRPLVTAKEGYANVPPGTKFGGGAGSAEQPGGDQAADSSASPTSSSSQGTPLVEGAAPESLYEWSDGRLQPVSELPRERRRRGGRRAMAGSGHGLGAPRGLRRRLARVLEHGRLPSRSDALYVRDTESQETGRLDVARAGASGAGEANPLFRAPAPTARSSSSPTPSS